VDKPRPSPRTDRTRRVPHPVQTRLAERGLLPPGGAGEREARRGRTGGGASGEAPRGDDGVRAALAEERRRQDAAERSRAHAVPPPPPPLPTVAPTRVPTVYSLPPSLQVLSAKAEADSVAAAQADVEKQLAKVSQLEKSLSS